MNSEQDNTDSSIIRVEQALSKAQGLVRYLLQSEGGRVIQELEKALDLARTDYHMVLNEHREECRQIQKYQREKVARLIT